MVGSLNDPVVDLKVKAANASLEDASFKIVCLP